MIPLVSAIISTYNSEKFIEGKIVDLLQQTIADQLEIIIINSGSQQNEDTIIRKFMDKCENIVYIKTRERETIYKAWNRAIELATAKYVTNTNTDDRLRKDTFEIFASFLDKNTDIAMVYGDQYISHTPNQVFDQIKNEKRTYRPDYTRLKLLKGYLAGSQSFWRRSIHTEDGIKFDEKFEVTGDYDFICRIAEKHKIKKINKILGVYYKDINKSNKEDQNHEQTYSEATSVRDIYARRFIQSLSETELLSLEKKLKMYSFLPKIILSGINRTEPLFPGFFTLDKIYMRWILSLINERNCKYETAIKLIKPYISRDRSNLLKIQLEKMQNKLVIQI